LETTTNNIDNNIGNWNRVFKRFFRLISMQMQARRKQPFAFGRGARDDASSASLQTILRQARKSGQLNLSNRSFTEGFLFDQCYSYGA